MSFYRSFPLQAANKSDSMTLTPGQWLGLPAIPAVTLYRQEDPAMVLSHFRQNQVLHVDQEMHFMLFLSLPSTLRGFLSTKESSCCASTEMFCVSVSCSRFDLQSSRVEAQSYAPLVVPAASRPQWNCGKDQICH